jgi:hypothetical protein
VKEEDDDEEVKKKMMMMTERVLSEQRYEMNRLVL